MPKSILRGFTALLLAFSLLGVSIPTLAVTKAPTALTTVPRGISKVFLNQVYDLSIRKWSSVYTPEYPWYWNKAQLIAESNLNPNAVSPVGAKGLGQFMPNTWLDMQRQLGHKGSVFTPALNIQAQAYYMRQLRNNFKKPRPEYDKHSLALASYNAGLGNILKAQKVGGNSLMYYPMIHALPKITGHHSKETSTYVKRIWDYIATLEGLE